MTSDIHSRTRLAGYDPARLNETKVLVVGAGALGQNVLMNLALTGIGSLGVVDFDEFEAHNATRSPLFPSLEQVARLGAAKAVSVAESVRKRATARSATCWYSVSTIQSLGDWPFAWADVVVSAVDNSAARAYLAERARLWAKPMVEGGFSGQRFSAAVFGPEPQEACWCCEGIEGEGTFSCTRYAAAAEEAGIIPALQTGAAATAALVSEAVLGWVHGVRPLRGHRVYGNLSKGTSKPSELGVSQHCINAHGEWTSTTVTSEADSLAKVCEAALREDVQGIVLPEEFVLNALCTTCGAVVEVNRSADVWLDDPRCRCCGGLAEISPEAAAGSLRAIDLRAPGQVPDGVHPADLGLTDGRLVLAYTSHDLPVAVGLALS